MRERRINRKHHALLYARLQAVEDVVGGNEVDKSVSVLIYWVSTLTNSCYDDKQESDNEAETAQWPCHSEAAGGAARPEQSSDSEANSDRRSVSLSD